MDKLALETLIEAAVDHLKVTDEYIVTDYLLSVVKYLLTGQDPDYRAIVGSAGAAFILTKPLIDGVEGRP